MTKGVSEATSTASLPLLDRDLQGARNAFSKRDKEASARAHSAVTVPNGTTDHSAEPHVEGGEFIKSFVFGGLDGILTSFAIVAGSAGAGLGVGAVLAIGISNVLADALAMGVGEYLSTKTEHEYIAEERAREAWELENYPEGEITESACAYACSYYVEQAPWPLVSAVLAPISLASVRVPACASSPVCRHAAVVGIFVERGMSHEDATEVITRMAKYPDFFVNLMMTEELGLQVPDEGNQSLLKGVVMFCAFATFGMLPIFGYVATDWVVKDAAGNGEEQPMTMLIAACTVTSVTLFALGAFKAHFAHKKYLRSGLETLMLGGACATLSYNVGLALSSLAK
mmetsp:Transcript_9769/g.26553  ORF Transcript_9769/g.26553 Transcript_9769/m.26553 type:complete len:342 (+) Transcript_9769:100-1125(+)